MKRYFPQTITESAYISEGRMSETAAFKSFIGWYKDKFYYF
ncbi:hypothetical protein D2M30_3639 [Bacillus amyloliquefaciens]|nr:hypothetical protein D2M30_3639 [Bacillus amyloliquefaciens]